MRHSLYFRNAENPKVRFPLAVPEKRIIVRAQVLRGARAGVNSTGTGDRDCVFFKPLEGKPEKGVKGVLPLRHLSRLHFRASREMSTATALVISG
jgi:hypothetical protein